MPEDYERVQGFAPFLKQIYDQQKKNGYWADFGTGPFEPEQARAWATRWPELWQTDTKDEKIEAIKQDWRDDNGLIIRDLCRVVEQAECASRHGVSFGVSHGLKHCDFCVQT